MFANAANVSGIIERIKPFAMQKKSFYLESCIYFYNGTIHLYNNFCQDDIFKEY